MSRRRKSGSSPGRFMIGALMLFFAAAFARPAALQEQDTGLYILGGAVAGAFLLGGSKLLTRVLCQDRILFVVSLSLCALDVLIQAQADFSAGLSRAFICTGSLLLMVAGSFFVRAVRPTLTFGLIAAVPTLVFLAFPLLTDTASLSLCLVSLALLMIAFVTLLTARYQLFAILFALAGTALLFAQHLPVPALIWSTAFLLLFWAYSGHLMLLLAGAGGVTALVFLFSGFPASPDTPSLFASVNPGWVGLELTDPILETGISSEASVFTWVAFRYGWIVAACVLLLYPVIMLRGSALARSSRSRLHGMLSMGAVLLTGLTAVAALLSDFGILASSGLSLPGLAADTPSLCVFLFLMGMLGGVSVRNQADLEEDAHIAMLAE